MVVAFNNADKNRALQVPLKGTPVQSAAALSLLFGGAKAELAGSELRLSMPAQSLSIFLVN